MKYSKTQYCKEPKFKIGNRVKIKNRKHFYGDVDFKFLSQYFDKSAIITYIELSLKEKIRYQINIDNGRYYWFEKDLIDIKEIRKEKLNKILKNESSL